MRIWVKAGICGMIAAAAAEEHGPRLVVHQAPLAEKESVETYRSEIMVTASRAEEEAFSLPYAVYGVSLNNPETNGLYRTTTDALRDVPGIMIQKTSNGQASPYLRGFTGFRTLMLVDGIRLNNSVFRDGPNQYWTLIDPYTIDRLEVVKGPSSALYGSDAVGGTVNALLRRPEGWTESGLYWFPQAFMRAATAERSLTWRGEINAVDDGTLGLLTGITNADYGDVQAGGGVGRQEKTSYDTGAMDFRLELRTAPHTEWTVAHYQFGKDDAWRTHRTVYGVSWRGAMVGDERARILNEEHSLSFVRYRREGDGLLNSLQLTASYQTLSEDTWRTRSNGKGEDQGLEVNTYGLDLQFQSQGALGNWTYGIEWYHDDVNSFRTTYHADGSLQSRDIQGPVADDARYDLMGIYIQDVIALSERIELTLGSRYTFAQADANRVKSPDTGALTDIDVDWDSLVGNMRLSWGPDNAGRWNVYGGVSQGFRAPNLSDLTRFDTARTNEVEIPSRKLDAEKFTSLEIGVKKRHERVETQIAYFYTDIKEMIIRTPTGIIIGTDHQVTRTNSGGGYVHGVELQSTCKLDPQWTLSGWFAWMYGEVETYPTSAPVSAMEPISRLMPPVGQLSLRWDHPMQKYWSEVVVTAAGAADKLSSSDKEDTQRIPPGGTPGYWVVDVRGGWRVNERLDLWAALDNVTNQSYRIHGSGINEPGINLQVGLGYRF